jgi:hypothetical protein
MSTLATVTEEIKFNVDLIKKYLSDQQNYYSKTLSAPPRLSNLVEEVKYDEIVTYSNINKTSSPYLPMGVIADNVYWISSIIREGIIAYQTKANVLTRQDLSYTDQLNELDDRLGWETNVLRGSTPEQIGILR